MDIIENLTKIEYSTLIISLFAILIGIKEGIELISYFSKKFRIKMGFQSDKDLLNNRILTLEKHDNWQYREISKMSQGIEDIKKSLDISKEETKKRIVVQYGAELYNLHDKFMAQGYITRAGLETFQMLADTYLECNGNHSIKGKIIPEVLSLPIKSE